MSRIKWELSNAAIRQGRQGAITYSICVNTLFTNFDIILYTITPKSYLIYYMQLSNLLFYLCNTLHYDYAYSHIPPICKANMA